MKALIQKELRENVKLAVLGLLIFCADAGWRIRFWKMKVGCWKHNR